MGLPADQCVSQLTSVLQPIVSVRRGTILGYEALCRHKGITELQNPSFLFAQAAHEGWRMSLENACLQEGCRAFVDSSQSESEVLLFMNVDVQLVGTSSDYFDEVAGIVRDWGLSSERVVLELSEAAVEDLNSLEHFCERAREHGFLIALDDVGTAHANFERLLAVRPTLLKLDISLITNLANDSWKREVVGGLVVLAQRIGSLVLAEGAERREDIMTALELGVDLFQGFYFAMPGFASGDEPGIRSKIDLMRAEFTSKTMASAEAHLARREWMFQYAHKLSSKLSSSPKSRRESVIVDELARNREIECVYLLDPGGIQTTPTYQGMRSMGLEGPLFQPADIGTNHSLKHYCIPLLAGAQFHLSTPYLSWASGTTCVTVCLRVLTTTNHFILCIDFRAEPAQTTS